MGRKIEYQAWVMGRKEKLHKLSPQQIIDDLKHDIELGREWSISPKELVEIISKPEFSEIKGNEIKTLILNYCSDLLEAKANLGEEQPDIRLVTYCYYTSHGDDAVMAKNRYKECLVTRAIDECLMRRRIDPNNAYFEKWRKSWETACLKNFCRYFGPELSRWEHKIKKRFDQDFDTHFSAENEEITNSTETEMLKTGN